MAEGLPSRHTRVPLAKTMAFDIEPQLARLSRTLPSGANWVYEPKWDGFRGLLAHLPQGPQLLSRRRRPFGGHYPELLDICRRLPPDTVLDGEIVAFVEGTLHFAVLQHRLSMDERRARVAALSIPVTFVAFDVLRWSGEDLMHRSLRERRQELEMQTPAISAHGVHVTPQTGDRELAASWLSQFLAEGIEGVVAKKVDAPYRPGQRDWVKVKSVRSVEAVVIGYIGSVEEPVLVLALYDGDGALYGFGSTYPLPRVQAGALRAVASRARETGKPIETRWGNRAGERWMELPPELVAEVAVTLVDHGRLRHLARFLRWRPDRDPRSCTAEQLRSRPS
jgi:ATP-dependent DNA ligase